MFDRAVSDLMYMCGYDPNKISNFWFLRDQYSYLKDVLHIAELSSDPFHVFESLVWLMLALNLAQLIWGIIFLGYSDDVRSKWTKRDLSGVKYILFLFAFGTGGLLMSTLDVKDFIGPRSMQRLLAYSPKAVIGVEAYCFCIGSLIFEAAILASIQLKFGRLRTRDC